MKINTLQYDITISATALVQPAPYNTIALVVGECRGKDKLFFYSASLIDCGSLQVSCRFPNLFR